MFYYSISKTDAACPPKVSFAITLATTFDVGATFTLSLVPAATGSTKSFKAGAATKLLSVIVMIYPLSRTKPLPYVPAFKI